MKERITISVPSDLIREADRVASRCGVRSRSALVSDALRLLVRKATSEEVDASLDAYYGSRTPAERAEEAAMVRAFRRSRRGQNLDRRGE